MEWWQIYLITRLDSIKELACIFAVISTICTVVTLIFSLVTRATYCDGSDYDKKQVDKICPFEKVCKFLCVPVMLFAAVLSVLIPTRDDVAVIIAGHWATHNAEMQKLPDNVLKTLNGLLEKAQEKIK